MPIGLHILSTATFAGAELQIVTETVWFKKLKTFTIWSFTGKVWQPVG